MWEKIDTTNILSVDKGDILTENGDPNVNTDVDTYLVIRIEGDGTKVLKAHFKSNNLLGGETNPTQVKITRKIENPDLIDKWWKENTNP